MKKKRKEIVDMNETEVRDEEREEGAYEQQRGQGLQINRKKNTDENKDIEGKEGDSGHERGQG